MIVGILLAAGSAKRFGSQKLLARLPDGRQLVDAAAKSLHENVERVVAVCGRDDVLQSLLERSGCEVVVNERANEGMGTSIAAGVSVSEDAAGWVIALGDMPFVRADTIRAIATELTTTMLNGKCIVVPMIDGKPGHPVGFSRDFADELRALDGDRGARLVIDRHRNCVVELAVDDPGILLDIDTPADFAAGAGPPN